MSARVHVALGSNVSDRAKHLAAALDALDATPGIRIVEEGPVSLTEALLPPDDPTPQEKYLNTVVTLETTLAPRALLDALLAIETRLGRVRTGRWAPRTIDLDVVLWGDRVVQEPGLTVPHPELHRRRFVLEPLAALAPDARHPLLGKTMLELLAALDA